ncbi:unnamed protein product [Tuber aestivum]|uniref:Uncharacterized protein n=1 Tax=Tuber aestivum TaxID=59557 RepID=A0A292PQD5_9PEZI|nr:unnamed protein product [Tuber aestivum]
MALVQFEKVIHDMAIKHLKVPEESVGRFIQDQVQEIHKLFGQVHAISERYQLWGKTPNYFCKRDIAKQACGFPGQLIAGFLLSGKQIPEFSPEDEQLVQDLVAVMENEESVHDFLDTKPYVDHWGGMSEQDFIDLARRIVIDLNAMHEHTDEDNKFMALTREERIEDLLDLLKKCKGTLYAMWKMSLYEECLKDPRGMQIRFVDNQKNNWQKKSEGRKRKLRDAEIEEQEAVTGVRAKKRRQAKSKPEVPLEELGMEYFDDPRGVPLAPPEKPLARKGVNTGRTSSTPKRIFRGPKYRAIEAIRQASTEREAPQSANKVEELMVPAEVRLEKPLHLTIVPAQGSAVREAGMVLSLKAFQPAQEDTGISRGNQNAEVLREQVQEHLHEPGLPEVVEVPKVVTGSQEYFGAGMDNMEAATAQESDFDSWDFLLDPRFLVQDDTPRNALDDVFVADNTSGQTFPMASTSGSGGSNVPGMDFFGSGLGTSSGPGASQSLSNASGRVPANIKTENFGGGPGYNPAQLRETPGTQVLRNSFPSIHSTTNGISNPAFQGFNFNEQVSGTPNPHFFQVGHFPARHDVAPYQYVNPSWLQNSGQSSYPAPNTATSSSAGAASNVFQNSTLYSGESEEAGAIESMTGNEWLARFDGDIKDEMDLFPF